MANTTYKVYGARGGKDLWPLGTVGVTGGTWQTIADKAIAEGVIAHPGTFFIVWDHAKGGGRLIKVEAEPNPVLRAVLS